MSNIKERTIPEISDERLHELSVRIKPVIRVRNEWYEISDVDLRKVAFTWDPKAVGKPLKLETVATIDTYHNWGYYGFFKPSIAEVITAIPEEYLDEITHFWLDTESATERRPFLVKPDEFNTGGYHMASVLLMRRVPRK